LSVEHSAPLLRRDVELAKQLGFDRVRKHQKTRDPRWLARADRLGLLVFTELPAAPAFSPVAVRRGLAEWSEIVRAHGSVTQSAAPSPRTRHRGPLRPRPRLASTQPLTEKQPT